MSIHKTQKQLHHKREPQQNQEKKAHIGADLKKKTFPYFLK